MKSMDNEKLKQELVRIYQNRPEIPATDIWQQNVMRKIRRMGLSTERLPVLTDFGASVWKIAPVMAILLLLMISGAVWLGPSADTLIADLFLSDPVDVVFRDIFRG